MNYTGSLECNGHCNKEFRDLHRSLSVVRAVKCKGLQWVGYVVLIEK
jgi:hypothetical protein